jgi:2-dehydropantoate 2-reductase
VGGYYGARLVARGHQVWFLSRGRTLDELRERGLEVRSDHGDLRLPSVHATDRGAEAGPVDAVLFCVKMYDNEVAADAVAPAVVPGTSITSLQNGVESEQFLASRFPEAVVLGGVARIEAWREGAGVIVQRGPQTALAIGPFRPEDRPAAEALATAFDGTGVPFTLSDDIRSDLWNKLMSICGAGGVTAYCRCSMGDVLSDERLHGLIASAMREVATVGGTKGMVFAPDAVEGRLRYFGERLDAGFKSSMCRDAEAGRPLEVEWLNGAVVRFGETLGIATPANRVIYDELLPLHRAAMARRAAGEQPDQAG